MPESSQLLLIVARGRYRWQEGSLARIVKPAREDELLQNAIRLFSRGGFQQTSLQEIASELGITRPLFYYYFESKEDLLWRIIGHLGDLLEQAEPIGVAAPQRLSGSAGFSKNILRR